MEKDTFERNMEQLTLKNSQLNLVLIPVWLPKLENGCHFVVFRFNLERIHFYFVLIITSHRNIGHKCLRHQNVGFKIHLDRLTVIPGPGRKLYSIKVKEKKKLFVCLFFLLPW